MAFAIGVGLALLIGLGATWGRWDRDRVFYPTVLCVVASYYALFAVMSGSMAALGAELLPIAAFLAAAIVGFRRSLWIVVAGLAGHGVFDYFHAGWIDDPGVPAWWPSFCGAYDVVAAAYLACRLRRSRS